jgi:hypothetical protein
MWKSWRASRKRFVASETLKPVDFVDGALAITDGKTKGWADPHYYILYVNRPDAAR